MIEVVDEQENTTLEDLRPCLEEEIARGCTGGVLIAFHPTEGPSLTIAGTASPHEVLAAIEWFKFTQMQNGFKDFLPEEQSLDFIKKEPDGD